MGKGSDKRRTSARDAKRQSAKRGSHHRVGAGINQFAEVRRAAWKKPPIERLYERGVIDDLELWAARRFAVGFMAMINPVTPRGGMHLDRVDVSYGPSSAPPGYDTMTVVDDYLMVAAAMDRDDFDRGRFRGFTREIVTAVCVVDMALSVIESRWRMGHGTVLRHLKRGLGIYAQLVERPDRAPPATPMVYALSTSVG